MPISTHEDRDTFSAAETAELQQRASALYQSGQLEKALGACTEIIRREPQRADLHAFAGMIALKLGDNESAARFYRAALDRQPGFVEAHYNFGTALQRLGQIEDAIASFRRAIELRPDLAPAHHNLGNALQALGQLKEAEASYRKTLDLAPEAADTVRNLGLVLQKLKKFEEAETAFRRAITLKPEWSNAHNNLVNLLLESGAAAQAIEVCDLWLAWAPGSVEAMAFKCVALNEAGDRDNLDYLLDFNNFVMTKRWTEIPGFGSVDQFNHALAEHVRAHPTLKVPPRDDPTYHHPKLHITDELLGEETGPMAALETMMRSAIAEYQKFVADGPEHPFLVNWPAHWRISSWGVILEGAGNLVPHIHLDGYLGGVYYPLIPDIVGDDEKKAGWFELGRPPSELPLKAKPIVKPIKPEEGLMILFPGYYYHSTVPFKSKQQRISVAFDLVAEDR